MSTDGQEATLGTLFGDKYKIEVKTDGKRHSVVVTCNGALILTTINEKIPRGFVYEPPESEAQ